MSEQPPAIWDGLGGSVIGAVVTLLGIILAYQFGRRAQRHALAHENELRAAEGFTEELMVLEDALTRERDSQKSRYLNLAAAHRRYDRYLTRTVPAIRNMLIHEVLYLPEIALRILRDIWIPPEVRESLDGEGDWEHEIDEGAPPWGKQESCLDTVREVRHMLTRWRGDHRMHELPREPAYVGDPSADGLREWDFSGEIDDAIRAEWLKYDKRMRRRERVRWWTSHPIQAFKVKRQERQARREESKRRAAKPLDELGDSSPPGQGNVVDLHHTDPSISDSTDTEDRTD